MNIPRSQDNGIRGNRNSSPSLARLTILVAMFLAIMAIIATAIVHDAIAEDELYLTAVVKSVNQSTGIVYVEVVSASCNGMRMFRADKIEEMQKYIGQKVSFFIDSDHCADAPLPVIVASKGVWK